MKSGFGRFILLHARQSFVELGRLVVKRGRAGTAIGSFEKDMSFTPRILCAALALAVTAGAPVGASDWKKLPPGSYDVAQVSDPNVYALEEQVRQLNGRIEELTFQLLQLQEQLRKTQEDNEFRFQQLEGTSDRSDAGETAMPQRDTADGGNTAPIDEPSMPAMSENTTDGSAPRLGAPEQALGTLTIDGTGNVTGGSVTFDEQSIGSAIDGSVVASVDTPENPEAFYRQGYGHVLNGDYNLAEGVFRAFLELYPNDPLTPDARFWLAESVRGQGRLEEAVEVFIAVRRDYPKSQKAPETLLKIGEIMADLGDRDVACVTFDDAITSYPAMSDTVRQRIDDQRAKAQC
jgi:tol-pal system protein YbgF